MKNLILFSFLLCSLASFSQTYYFEDSLIYNNNSKETIFPVTAVLKYEYLEEEGGYAFAIIGYNEDEDSEYILQFVFIIHSYENPDFYFRKEGTNDKNEIVLKDIYNITLYDNTLNETPAKNLLITISYENGDPFAITLRDARKADGVDIFMHIPYTEENRKKVYELVEKARKEIGSN